jgi:hypothetical protein
LDLNKGHQALRIGLYIGIYRDEDDEEALHEEEALSLDIMEESSDIRLSLLADRLAELEAA